MRPHTSQWRDAQIYDYYDDLDPEGLAWECLRRDVHYQRHYRALIRDNAEKAPLAPEALMRWGLRFPGPTGPDSSCARRSVVSPDRSRRTHADPGAGAARRDSHRHTRGN